MSVRKNFRLEDYSNALLEEIAAYRNLTQTEVIEQLIRDYVVFELPAVEGNELMQRASQKLREKEQLTE